MTIDLTQIILAVITLIGGLIARYVIPWLKGKLDERQSETLCTLVDIFVYAAEMIYNSEQGQEKKQYVLDMLKLKGYNIDDESINALIEATVKRLKIEMK